MSWKSLSSSVKPRGAAEFLCGFNTRSNLFCIQVVTWLIFNIKIVTIAALICSQGAGTWKEPGKWHLNLYPLELQWDLSRWHQFTIFMTNKHTCFRVTCTSSSRGTGLDVCFTSRLISSGSVPSWLNTKIHQDPSLMSLLLNLYLLFLQKAM